MLDLSLKMVRRREYPLYLPISLESLPAPGNLNREKPSMLRFTEEELGKIKKTAEERGELPSVLLRTIVLTAFQDSALRALSQKPDLLDMTPAEQQKALLDVFTLGRPRPERPEPLSLPPEVKRNERLLVRFSKGEFAMIEKAARERGEVPAVLIRRIVLTVLQNSERRPEDAKADLLHMSPTEQQKALLEAFNFEK